MHQELEFTVSFEDTFEVCRRLKELYEELYPSGLPYTLFECDSHRMDTIVP